MTAPTQTDAHVQCNATVTDLVANLHPLAGAHTLDIYVFDNAGNFTMNHSTFTVAVDNAAPTYSNFMPVDGSTILTSTITSSLLIETDYSDAAPSSGVMPMIHVNDSHDGTTGAMIMGCTKTATHYSCPAVKAKRLHLGSNWIEVLLSDTVGNKNYSDPSRMNWYTVVDDVNPTVNSITNDGTTIIATFSDPEPVGRLSGSASLASGIYLTPGSEMYPMIHVDGICLDEIVTCTVDANSISCPIPPGLTPGSHTMDAHVSDNAGNVGSGSGSLCVSGKPGITVSKGPAFWQDYAAYTAGELSIRLRFTNGGPNDAYHVTLTGSSNTFGVTLSTATPFDMGDLISGASAEFVVNYQVPSGVHTFKSSITGSASDVCGRLYTYPV